MVDRQVQVISRSVIQILGVVEDGLRKTVAEHVVEPDDEGDCCKALDDHAQVQLLSHLYREHDLDKNRRAALHEAKHQVHVPGSLIFRRHLLLLEERHHLDRVLELLVKLDL